MVAGVILLILALGSTADAFNVLILFPTPLNSHQAPVIAITEGLIKKGHHVFVVSPTPIPELKNNYTHVDVSYADKLFTNQESADSTVILQTLKSKYDVTKISRAYADIAGVQYRSEAFLKFQKRVKAENKRFDVIIVESHFIPYTCAISRMLTGTKPIITLSTVSHDLYGEENLGSITHLSYLPSIHDTYTPHMTLWQKIENWYSHHYIWATLHEAMETSARAFFREVHGPDSEALVDGCWTNSSLAMIASNFVYSYPRLLGPNVIELGPMQIKPPVKLPKVLQEWLDGAEKGVIYFSMGTNVKSRFLPELVRSNLLKFFGDLPAGYRVLWKWELDGKIPGQPDNILPQKWVPQQSVLAHPKVKVFVTQGGLQSFQETVHFGVPVVGVPWGGDQEGNVAKMLHARVGVRLRPHELESLDKIKAAIESVLYDESYSRNMRKLSAISRDFTSQALDKAVFWIEHVAKFGGAHLRPSTADTTYFEFFCLDIISAILVIALITLYCLVSLIKFLFVILCPSPNSKIKKS